MTYKDAVSKFIGINKEELNSHSDDYCYKQLMWSCYVDSLCKCGEITNKQFSNWGTPKCCNKGVIIK